MILENAPSYQEYDRRIAEYESNISVIKNENALASTQCCGNHQRDSKFCGTYGGVYNVDKFRPTDRNNAQWKSNVKNIHSSWTSCQKNALDKQIRDLNDYKEAVVQIRRIENDQAVTNQMQAQAKLIEEQIKETFRIQSEKYLTVTPASTVNTDSTMLQIVSNKPDTAGFIAENPVLNSSQQNTQSPQTQNNGSPLLFLGILGALILG